MRGRIGIILGFVALAVGPAAAQRSTQIVISQPADATTMDPGRSTQVLTVNYFFNLYDTLTRWDAALKLHPGLATSWKAINDTTWEVRLRPDVKFHDGSPLTAEDVKAVYERNMVPGKTVVQSGFATLESVQAVNPTTLRIVTRKPDPLVPVRMAQMGGSIYPARFTSDEGARELARKPIGSGAYKFVSWTKDDQLVMEANRDWWGWNGKPPAVDRVIWKPIPDDFARLSALQRGEVDVITNVPPDQMKIVRTLTVSSTRTLTFWINTTQPPTQDKRVRQVMHYAMDMWSKVGIRARIEMMEMAARQKVNNERLLPPNGVMLINPQSTLLDADGSLWRLFHPNGFGGKYWIGNQPGQRFHDLMEQARYTLDSRKRKELYTEATKIIHEEKPWLELFQEVVIYGVSKRVSFKPRPDYRLIVSEMTLAK